VRGMDSSVIQFRRSSLALRPSAVALRGRPAFAVAPFHAGVSCRRGQDDAQAGRGAPSPDKRFSPDRPRTSIRAPSPPTSSATMPIIKAGPYDVEYAEAGSGPAVVLLHSSAAGSRQWRKLMEERSAR